MTLLACQIFSTIAHEGSFARTAEQLHLTPSAISHAVSTMEAECGFPLFTRTKSGVTMTAAAENLLPAIQRLLASSESLDQSIAQINGMHKGVLRLGVFNSACVTWLPQLVPQFQLDFPGIDVQIYQGSYADICAWVKNGTAEIGFLSNSSALDLDFEPLYDDELVCIAPASYRPARPGCVSAEELRGQPFVSQLADVDADIQSYFKTNDLRVDSRCYIVDDQSMIAMVACGRGFAIMPELMFKTGTDPHGCQVLRLEPAATRSIGLACLARGALSPAARQFAAAPALTPPACGKSERRGGEDGLVLTWQCHIPLFKNIKKVYNKDSAGKEKLSLCPVICIPIRPVRTVLPPSKSCLGWRPARGWIGLPSATMIPTALCVMLTPTRSKTV